MKHKIVKNILIALFTMMGLLVASALCQTQHVPVSIQEANQQHSKCLSDAYNQYGGGQNTDAFNKATTECNEQFKKSVRKFNPVHPKPKTAKPKPDVVARAPEEWHPPASDINYPLIFILVVLGVVVYFIPSYAAWGKNHFDGIVLLNIFLGWTLLGWVGALIWAVCEKPAKPEVSGQ